MYITYFLIFGTCGSAGLFGCTYFPVQVAVQDYCDVHYLLSNFRYMWKCRTIGMYLLSGAGGSAGLTGALGSATGLSNQAAKVAVIRHTVQVRPVNQL